MTRTRAAQILLFSAACCFSTLTGCQFESSAKLREENAYLKEEIQRLKAKLVEVQRVEADIERLQEEITARRSEIEAMLKQHPELDAPFREAIKGR